MPYVIPVPLGGLGTEIGTRQDVLNAMESRRDRASTTSTPGTFVLPSTQTTMAYIAGMPDATVAVAGVGGALVVCSVDLPNPYGQYAYGSLVGISVDGATPVGAASAFVNTVLGASTVVFIGLVYPLTMDDHEFQMQMANTAGTTVDLQNPVLSVIPV